MVSCSARRRVTEISDVEGSNLNRTFTDFAWFVISKTSSASSSDQTNIPGRRQNCQAPSSAQRRRGVGWQHANAKKEPARCYVWAPGAARVPSHSSCGRWSHEIEAFLRGNAAAARRTPHLQSGPLVLGITVCAASWHAPKGEPSLHTLDHSAPAV